MADFINKTIDINRNTKDYVSIIFDGNDSYSIPIPSDAQINSGDWEIEFDIWIPSTIDASGKCIFCFGTTDDISGTWAEITLLQQQHNIYCYVYDDAGSYSEDISLYNVLNYDSWNYIKLWKTGSMFYLSANGSQGSDDWPGNNDVTGFDNVQFGCYIHAMVNGDAGEYSYLYNGTKVANLRGIWYDFGTCYTDIARTTIAYGGDDVASIENNGILSGYMEQSTSDKESTLEDLSIGLDKKEIGIDRYRHDFFELLFDGNDWYDLPLPTNAQLNGNWELEFDLMLDRDQFIQLFDEPIVIGSLDENNYSLICLEWTTPSPGVSDMAISIMVIDETGNWFIDEDSVAIPLTGTTWHHLKIEKVGTVLTHTWTDHNGTDYIMQVDHSGYTLDFSNQPVATLGAARSPSWTFNGSNPEYHLEPGTKIKNLVGTFWQTGALYIDIAQTTLAKNGDDVASIDNLCSIGGNMEQSTSGYRSSVEYYFTELNNKSIDIEV